MNKGGFWLKETTVYHTLIVDVGFHSHIRYLIRNHSAFQISKGTIERTYAKYNERMGFEGRAREELMITALTNGWIRVRHHLSPYDHWIIQCDGLRERKKAISDFLYWGLENGEVSNYDSFVLNDMRGIKFEYENYEVIWRYIFTPRNKMKIIVLKFTDEVTPDTKSLNDSFSV